MKIAVVTGASSGMGREFAVQLAQSHPLDEIWVIARSADKLDSLAREITETRLRPVPLDLQKQEDIDAYRRLLAEEKPEVTVLVNAAGYGIFKSLMETSPEDICGMIDLNAKALTLMTIATASYMPRGSRIYQLGSGSSFQPVPYMNVYGASKAYVLSLSRALNMELRDSGIGVTAVCPGYVSTEFFKRAIVDNSSVTNFDRYYTPQEVVACALRDGGRGKDLSVCGLHMKLQVLLVKLCPVKMVMNTWLKQQGHKS